MHVHVPTVRPDSSLADVIQKADIYQVSSLPVMDADRKALGLVVCGKEFKHNAAENLAKTVKEMGYEENPVFAQEAELANDVAKRLALSGAKTAIVRSPAGTFLGTLPLKAI